LRYASNPAILRGFQDKGSKMHLRSTAFAVLAASAAAAATAAPVPKDQLLQPPADAQRYVIVSESNTHGDEWRWTTADGAIAFRKSQELRGWITEIDGTVRLDAAGNPVDLNIRGVTLSGDAAEVFRVKDGTASWDSGADRGEAAAGGAFYYPRGGPESMQGLLAERLVTDDDGVVKLLPSGTARLVKGAQVRLDGKDGPVTAQLVLVEGLNAEPKAFWVDQAGKHFATIGWMGLIREGYEQHFRALRDAQDKAVLEATRAIGAQFLTDSARAPVVIENVKLFDADAGRFLDGMSVMASGGRITAVESTSAFTAPADVRRIDGSGKTLVPGIWDSHKHFDNEYDLLANVATGMTSVRSPGNGMDDTRRLQGRRAAGEIVAPEMFVAVVIDRKDPLSAQGAELVSSEAETIAAVRKIKDEGLWGVKFYTSMNPAWIAPAAAEAHQLGLRVLGHVPAGMRPLDAVRAGYDELTHLNFVLMQAMPQSVVDISNTRARMEGPAEYGRTVNLDSPEMKAFISELAERGIWVDPTIALAEMLFTQDAPELGRSYGPYAGTLPAVYERGLAQGGYPLFGEVTRADMRASFAKMVELIGKLHAAGVRIVAGTDGWGLELFREIEIYHEAGMSPAEALQTATINPARLVGVADRTGSIKVGKEADMVLVAGDVANDLGALRRVVTVISDGYVMDGDALRAAAGFSGMPK
jgi:imidazolonepropionase-like amidohydrolase